MSYETALLAAGADVLAFKEFGSYQGDWWAKVAYKGETGWVQGSYGSCSGCDAFQAEFDYTNEECEEHQWRPKAIGCSACKEASTNHATKLADFGRGYLDDLLLTQARAEEEAARHIEWDEEAQEMLDWIRANAIAGSQ